MSANCSALLGRNRTYKKKLQKEYSGIYRSMVALSMTKFVGDVAAIVKQYSLGDVRVVHE